MEVACGRVGALPQFCHSTNRCDGTRGVVPPLGSPDRHCAVVHGRAQGQIGLDVPLEVRKDITLPLVLLDQIRMIAHVVQDGEPVSWRGFRVWPIGPEFSQYPGVVSPRHHVGGVRVAGGRVHGVPRAGRPTIFSIVEVTVGGQGGGECAAVANGPWADVPHDPIRRVQHSGPLGHHAVGCSVEIGGPRAIVGVHGRRPRVMVDLVIKSFSRVSRQIIRVECPRRHLTPLWGKEGGRFAGNRIATLVDEQVQSEGLPAVEVADGGISREVHNQRLIDRFVRLVGEVVGFVGPVLHSEGDDLRGEVVAQGPAIAVAVIGVGEIDVVPKGGHVEVVPHHQVVRIRSIRKAMLQKAVHPEGNGFVPGFSGTVRRLKAIKRCREPVVVHSQKCRA